MGMASSELPSRPQSVLEEAAAVVGGGHREAYGSVNDSFSTIGRIWAAVLSAHLDLTIDPIPPRIVGLMMVGLKVARDTNAPKRDNLVDIAGYAQCVSELEASYDKH